MRAGERGRRPTTPTYMTAGVPTNFSSFSIFVMCFSTYLVVVVVVGGGGGGGGAAGGSINTRVKITKIDY